MNEDLFVRIVGSIGTIAILFVGIIIGILLGNTSDEILAWSMISTVTMSLCAVIVIHRFEDEIDSFLKD